MQLGFAVHLIFKMRKVTRFDSEYSQKDAFPVLVKFPYICWNKMLHKCYVEDGEMKMAPFIYFHEK